MQTPPVISSPVLDLAILGKGALWTRQELQSVLQQLGEHDKDDTKPIPEGFEWLVHRTTATGKRGKTYTKKEREDVLRFVTFSEIKKLVKTHQDVPDLVNKKNVPKWKEIWDAAEGKENVIKRYYDDYLNRQKEFRLLLAKSKVVPPPPTVTNPNLVRKDPKVTFVTGGIFNKERIYWKHGDRENRLKQLEKHYEEYENALKEGILVELINPQIEKDWNKYKKLKNRPSFEAVLKAIFKNGPNDAIKKVLPKTRAYDQIFEAASQIYALPSSSPLNEIAKLWLQNHFGSLSMEDQKKLPKAQIQFAAGVFVHPPSVEELTNLEEQRKQILHQIEEAKRVQEQREKELEAIEQRSIEELKRGEKAREKESNERARKRAREGKNKEPSAKRVKPNILSLWEGYNKSYEEEEEPSLKEWVDLLPTIHIRTVSAISSSLVPVEGWEILPLDQNLYEWTIEGDSIYNLFYAEYFEKMDDDTKEKLAEQEINPNISTEVLFRIWSISLKIYRGNIPFQKELMMVLNRLVQNHRNTLSGDRTWMDRLVQTMDNYMDEVVEQIQSSEPPLSLEQKKETLSRVLDKWDRLSTLTLMMYAPILNEDYEKASDLLETAIEIRVDALKKSWEEISQESQEESSEVDQVEALIRAAEEEGNLTVRVLNPDTKQSQEEIRFFCPLNGDQITPRFGGWRKNGVSYSKPYHLKEYLLDVSRTFTSLPKKQI